jgi:ATP-binding cassette, subfamily B, bacterial
VNNGELYKNLPEKPFKGLMYLLKGKRIILAGTLLSQSIAVASSTAGFFLLRYIVDDVIIKENWSTPLYLFALAFIGFAINRGIFNYFEGKGSAYISEGIIRGLRNYVFDHIQKLSFTYHDTNKTGELIQKSTSDIRSIRQFYSNQLLGISRIFFFFIINFICIISIDIKLALFSSMMIPVILVLSIFFFKKIHKAFDNYQKQDAVLSTILQENLTGVRIVRAFARQDFEKAKFETENINKFKTGKKFLLNHSVYWPVSRIICSAQLIIGLSIGGYMTFNGDISVGTYLMYFSFVFRIIWPIQQMGRNIAQVSTSYVSYKRVANILKEQKEDLFTGYYSDINKIRGKVVFDNVSFQYDHSAPVLKDITFFCKRGMKIALIGETGSGKTSLVNLLPRFYNLTKGNIFIDNKPLDFYSRHYLRQNIGIVEQEPFLFSASIKENIAYGVEDADMKNIIKAAKSAAIHDEIEKFEHSYDTVIGEKGITLSGGQKQRIAIARTLLKDPGILILDDSTSSVDTETEDIIQNALKVLMENRTTFIIAHKIQSLSLADKILVFENGKIIQEGSHSDLIDIPGFYRKIFRLQTILENELQEELK